ncbi:hypothetical protein V5F49_13325 [Xanthobacter sp. V3C-3]|uniref:hypothetical protein n=1 Tax=Xanthobacter lutulentifluminis TaxID=3119935 RepID=UPI0037271C8D
MNTANLQMEGLLLALSRLIETLRLKGLLTQQEIEAALREADEAARTDCAGRNISPAQAEGVRFPIRFLLAGTHAGSGPVATFSSLATLIGTGRDRQG